jgi:hypothetical protein
VRYERGAEAARQAGKHWEAMRELEKSRDAALARVDDVITTISVKAWSAPPPHP